MATEDGSSSQDMMNNNKRKNRSSYTNTPKRIKSTHSTSSVTTACTSGNNADNEEMEDRPRILQCETRPVDLFTCLPPEVITHVLSYLPLRDRKSVRLACKILNECSKHVSIAKDEKLVFPGSRTVSSSHIREILLRTKYATLNLEFYGTEQRIHSLHVVDFWRMCGDRVRSLYFNSPLGFRVLVDIFENCRNLQVFGCRNQTCRTYRLTNLLGYALDHLIQLNVVCTELHTLKFYAISGMKSTSLFQKIFTVFPNIKHLHATYQDLESKTEGLKPFAQLQSFTYCPASSENIFSLEYLTALELPMRLTELRMHLHRGYLRTDAALNTLLRFLASQNQLRELSLTTNASGIRNSEREKLIMLHALRSCQKLRKFEFLTFIDLWLKTADEASEFLALISNLQCLKLRSLPHILNELSLPRTINFALNMLTLGIVVKRSPLLHILEHSPKLQYLMIVIGSLTTGILKEILRNKSELRTFGLTSGTLIVDEFNSPDDADDCHIKILGSLYKYVQYFQSSLLRISKIGAKLPSNSPDLEYLELRFSTSYALPVREIPFRRMKHVKFVFVQSCLSTYMSIEDQLLDTLWNMPTVETVELLGLKLNLRYVELFQHLKNLRRLVCAEVESHNLKLLFKACPTLKFVSTGGIYDGQTFSFDSSTEQVISEPFLILAEQGCMDHPPDCLSSFVDLSSRW